jgi:hypothetical protein
VWTSSPGATLDVIVKEPSLVSKYVFGTRTAEFHTCARCGAVPVATSQIDGRHYAVVSVNAFEGFDQSLLRRASASFDGEGTETRLARRKRNWIADVRFIEGGT